jgi:hypothetical protein
VIIKQNNHLKMKRNFILSAVLFATVFTSCNDDVMILSDITSATDDGLIIINNFNSVLDSTTNLGTIAMNAQIRIYGSNTSLG